VRVPQVIDIPKFGEGDDVEQYLHDLTKVLGIMYENLAQTVNGNLGLGDGVDFDNLVGEWVTYSTNAVANTEDTIAHTLGAVPVGYFLLKPPLVGNIHIGSTTWTTSNIYLSCNAASQTASIFLLAPSQGVLV
tara:strand:- start:497 stop:895 length:399 start_codon:yes stop_codon:yes gene_type:complete